MGTPPLFFWRTHVPPRLIVRTAINDIYVPGLQKDVGMIAQTHRELCSDIEKYGQKLSGDCRVKRVRVCAGAGFCREQLCENQRTTSK